MSSSSAQTQDMSAALEPSSGYKPFLVEKEGALWEVALAAFWFFALATAHAYLQPIRYLLVLGFLAAIAFHYRQFLTNSVKLWFLYLYPAWAMMSFMWADSRNEAFRYGALQTVFVLILIYIASRLTMHQIIRALFWAFVLMGLQVFIEIPVIDAYTMPEGFGEKNMLASRMFFLFTACLYMLYTRRSLLIEKGLALVCAPLSFFVIIIAESATSLVLAILSAFVLTSVASIWQAVTRVRALSSLVLLFFAVSAVLLVLVSFSLFSQGPVNAFLDAVGKDATLTGRTELWQAASEQVAKKPWLGVGAESFWLVNRGEAQTWLEYFYKDADEGFSFHNSYWEFMVHLGVIGLFFFVVGQAYVVYRIATAWLKKQDLTNSFFFLIGMLLLARSMTESDLYVSFDISRMLLFLGGMSCVSQRLVWLPMRGRSRTSGKAIGAGA